MPPAQNIRDQPLWEEKWGETWHHGAPSAPWALNPARRGSFEFQSINPKANNYREKWCEETPENARHCFWGTPVKVLGWEEEPTSISPESWKVLDKNDIKRMAFQSNHTKNSLLDSHRTVKTLSADQPNRMVSIQLFNNKLKVVPASVLVLIRYPSLRLSGVPDSIDPDGGHAGWCNENPARCYFERDPHPKGQYDKQNQFRPQSQFCCFAPKCTECDPTTHFRMEENCIACPVRIVVVFHAGAQYFCPI